MMNVQTILTFFNAVAFNKVTMDWMVVGRLRLNKQTADAYALAFKKNISASALAKESLFNWEKHYLVL